MHDMLPFLRPNKDEVSEMVSAQCSLMQNQLYIALNMDEGIAKVDYVSRCVLFCDKDCLV